MTAKQVRWLCPNGHQGVLGPARPRRDNICRYCLACSAKEGKLVERTSPTVERSRATSADRSKAKAAAKRRAAAKAKQRAKERDDARYTVGGVDVRVEFRRLCRLRAFGGKDGRLVRRPPMLTVRHYRRRPSSRLGWASPDLNEVRINLHPTIDLADVHEILVHELSHIVAGRDRSDRRWHSDDFWRLMDKAFREAYGDVGVRFRFDRYHGRYAAAIRARDTTV